jgi:hypothetical protein
MGSHHHKICQGLDDVRNPSEQPFENKYKYGGRENYNNTADKRCFKKGLKPFHVTAFLFFQTHHNRARQLVMPGLLFFIECNPDETDTKGNC